MRFISYRTGVVAGILSAAVVLAMALAAQEPKTEKKEEVFIGGEPTKWSVRTAKDRTIYTITGNVTIKHLDTVVTASKVEYTQSTDEDQKLKIAVAEGNLKIVDPENEITGDKAIADLNARKIVVEGSVKLISRPKPEENPGNPDSPRAKLRQPTTLTCDRLEYLYRKKIATAEGNLKITQKDRVLLGKKVVYDLKQEIVTLTGGVSVTDENGQTFTSSGTVKASFKQDDEWIEADNGSAAIKVKVEEEAGAEGAKPAENIPEKK